MSNYIRRFSTGEAGGPETLQEKRNKFVVCEPIFDLNPGKFAHVHGASVGHLSLTKRKRKIPEIFDRAEAPEFKVSLR
jgi:hypothetical protein